MFDWYFLVAYYNEVSAVIIGFILVCTLIGVAVLIIMVIDNPVGFEMIVFAALLIEGCLLASALDQVYPIVASHTPEYNEGYGDYPNNETYNEILKLETEYPDMQIPQKLKVYKDGYECAVFDEERARLKAIELEKTNKFNGKSDVIISNITRLNHDTGC
jgi:hypothetical protein